MANKTLQSLKEQVNFFLANSSDHETEARKIAASLFEGTALACGGYKGLRYLRLDEINGEIPGIKNVDYDNQIDETGVLRDVTAIFEGCDQTRTFYY